MSNGKVLLACLLGLERFNAHCTGCDLAQHNVKSFHYFKLNSMPRILQRTLFVHNYVNDHGRHEERKVRLALESMNHAFPL